MIFQLGLEGHPGFYQAKGILKAQNGLHGMFMKFGMFRKFGIYIE